MRKAPRTPQPTIADLDAQIADAGALLTQQIEAVSETRARFTALMMQRQQLLKKVAAEIGVRIKRAEVALGLY